MSQKEKKLVAKERKKERKIIKNCKIRIWARESKRNKIGCKINIKINKQINQERKKERKKAIYLRNR